MSAPLDMNPDSKLSAGVRREVGRRDAEGFDGVGRHQAWQRAMEREQCQSWFNGNGPGDPERRGHDAGAAPSPSMAPSRASRSLPGAGLATSARTFEAVPSWVASRASWQTTGPEAARTAACLGDGTRREVEVATPQPWDADRIAGIARAIANAAIEQLASRQFPVPSEAEVDVGVSPQTARKGAPLEGEGGDHEPMNLHAEWSEQGLRLWLRIDPRLPAERIAAQIVDALRPRCGELGSEILSVVCNGRTAWTRPTTNAIEEVV